MKGKLLFHASSVCGLKTIMPQSKTCPEGFKNGPVVFATDDFAFSTMFIVSHDDSWANGGSIGDTLFFVIASKDKFTRLDRGGCVYMVSSRGFVNYNKREWFTTKKVKVLSIIHYDSGLLAMVINNVQVYFVDSQIYQKIQNSADHGASIMNNMKSENEKMGFYVEKLDVYKGSKKVV